VDDLSLEIADLDCVGVDDAQLADARGGEIQRRGGAESSRTDEQHARTFEAALSLLTQLGEDEMPIVPAQFVECEV
jgi:hypothetical protein